jgi:hypothetical protein
MGGKGTHAYGMLVSRGISARAPPETTAGAQGPCVNIKCETEGAARYICDWRPPEARVSAIR